MFPPSSLYSSNSSSCFPSIPLFLPPSFPPPPPLPRYCQLEDPMAHRHQHLEDSLRLHQFIHDKEDELRWVREREPLASSSALGNSLTTVQSLLKKHQVTYPLEKIQIWIAFHLVCALLWILHTNVSEMYLTTHEHTNTVIVLNIAYMYLASSTGLPTSTLAKVF